MSIGEWVIDLDRDLQITEVRRRFDVNPDPNNGTMGIMSAHRMEGCIHDKWTAKLKPIVSWKPQSPQHTWAYAREHYPNDTWMFYTNAIDELGAFTNLQAWLRAQGEQHG